MKKEARVLLAKAVDSIVLAVDHFNRTSERSRAEAVLVLLDRGFELLLKSAILHRNGRIREPARDSSEFNSRTAVLTPTACKQSLPLVVTI
jgi:hypothetical protein